MIQSIKFCTHKLKLHNPPDPSASQRLSGFLRIPFWALFHNFATSRIIEMGGWKLKMLTKKILAIKMRIMRITRITEIMRKGSRSIKIMKNIITMMFIIMNDFMNISMNIIKQFCFSKWSVICIIMIKLEPVVCSVLLKKGFLSVICW